eukprot:COSAG01_NODE_45183_length_411_cov_9.413462_1_plen_83_part_01
MKTENTIGGRRLRWGLWGVSGLRGSASWFGGSSRHLHRRTEHTLSSVTVIKRFANVEASQSQINQSTVAAVLYVRYRRRFAAG